MRYNHCSKKPAPAARYAADAARETGKAIDDDKFKAEVLSRLDRIVSLLSANCSMTKAALERAYPDLMKPKQPPQEQGELLATRIVDEMQEDYAQAVQKWKSEKGL